MKLQFHQIDKYSCYRVGLRSCSIFLHDSENVTQWHLEMDPLRMVEVSIQRNQSRKQPDRVTSDEGQAGRLVGKRANRQKVGRLAKLLDRLACEAEKSGQWVVR